MYCTSGGESDATPIIAMQDLGRPRPLKKPAGRLAVNPNFLFFCQIVLLVIPITILFAGLYFMNIPPYIIILTCGGIIFAVFCVFLFVKPFHEEKCVESSKRKCEYSPIGETIDVEPSAEAVSQVDSRRAEKRRNIYHGYSGDEDDSPPEQHDSTDTLLSMPTHALPEVSATLPPSGFSSDGRCWCCEMGCRGNDRRHQYGVTWDSKGCTVLERKPPSCLEAIEEEEVKGSPRCSEKPCTERTPAGTTPSTKTNVSNPDNRQSLSSDGRTIPRSICKTSSKSTEHTSKSPRTDQASSSSSPKPPDAKAFNSFKDWPPRASPKQSVLSKRKGFVEDQPEELELVPTKQSIFQQDENYVFSKSEKPTETKTVHFQLCSSDKTKQEGVVPDNCTNQPILIKLFPTTSKVGYFSWEANTVKPQLEYPINNPLLTIFDHPEHKTAHAQTIAPATVDTQTSTTFPKKRTSEGQTRKTCQQITKGKSAHQATSGSIVDFVLRPFSKAKQLAGHVKSKKSESNAKTSKPKEKKSLSLSLPIETDDTLKFDLLKIASSTRKGSEEHGNKSASPKKATKKPDKVDICSIYYSSIHGKLYQPTKSGLLATESSKEEVDLQRLHSNTVKDGQASPQNVKRPKRKSDDERRTNSKCAKHDAVDAKMKNSFGADTNRVKNDQITFMCPPINLDYSSGPCDEEPNLPVKKQTECRIKKPHSQKISHQVETKLFKKSSSSYENVVIEKIIKQKKRTLKKFK